MLVVTLLALGGLLCAGAMFVGLPAYADWSESERELKEAARVLSEANRYKESNAHKSVSMANEVLNRLERASKYKWANQKRISYFKGRVAALKSGIKTDAEQRLIRYRLAAEAQKVSSLKNSLGTSENSKRGGLLDQLFTRLDKDQDGRLTGHDWLRMSADDKHLCLHAGFAARIKAEGQGVVAHHKEILAAALVLAGSVDDFYAGGGSLEEHPTDVALAMSDSGQ